jgi:DinB superfamily
MDIRSALKGQYHGCLAMLKAAIVECPEEMWNGGEFPRTFWRLAYHTLFYGHLYMMQTMEDFQPWEKHRVGWENIFEDATPIEICPKATVLEYLDFLDAMVNDQVDALDLDSQQSGFDWYTMPKIDHQFVNIRHIQEHTGQLRERLFEKGHDLRWVGRA